MSEPHDLHDPMLRDRAVRAARGQDRFDVLLTGGRVADVATGELREADVGLVGPLIASVHPPGTRSDAREHIALAGRVIAPGLIDSHLHIESSMVTPRRYAEVVVPQGTTTICWDPHEIGNVSGLGGLRWAIAATRGLPLRIVVLAPSCVPSAPGLERTGADFGPDEMREMLRWPEIAGVAEVMDMRGVLDRQTRMRGIVDAGLASGKLVCGHARGLAGADLQAFAAAGIESDHEITSGDDLLAKLRAGFTVELRGSHDYVLPGAVEALNTLPQIPQTLTICTDDVFPDDLVRAGGMIDVLRRLVRRGLAPMQALRCATLNAAMRLGRRDLGLIAPGRRADLIVLSDLTELAVTQVFASGELVATDGRLLIALPAGPPGAPVETMQLTADVRRRFRAACTRRERRPRAAAHGREAAVHRVGRSGGRGARRRRGTAGRCDPDGGDPSPRQGAGDAGAWRAARLEHLARRAGDIGRARQPQPGGVRSRAGRSRRRGQRGDRRRRRHGGRDARRGDGGTASAGVRSAVRRARRPRLPPSSARCARPPMPSSTGSRRC